MPRLLIEDSIRIGISTLKPFLREGGGRFEYQGSDWSATVTWLWDPVDDVLAVHTRHPSDLSPVNTSFLVVRRPQVPFGGEVWLFECPITGSWVPALYLPPGRGYFASRAAHGLAYSLENRSWRARLLAKRAKFARRRLGAMGFMLVPWDEPCPPRPWWMWKRTYGRIVEDWNRIGERGRALYKPKRRSSQRCAEPPASASFMKRADAGQSSRNSRVI